MSSVQWAGMKRPSVTVSGVLNDSEMIQITGIRAKISTATIATLHIVYSRVPFSI